VLECPDRDDARELSARLVLEIEIAERLPGRVLDDKAFLQFLEV
jgi:hypothetical protein